LLALNVKVGSFSYQPPIATPCRDSESRRSDASLSAIGAVKFVKQMTKMLLAKIATDQGTLAGSIRSVLHVQSPRAPERAEDFKLFHRAGTAWPRDLRNRVAHDGLIILNAALRYSLQIPREPATEYATSGAVSNTLLVWLAIGFRAS
jgi:hypothetical protein